MINYILPFINWNWGNPRVPGLYWDVYSQEERWKKLCLHLQKIYDFLDEEVIPKLNEVIDKINDLDAALQEEIIDRINGDLALYAYIDQEIGSLKAYVDAADTVLDNRITSEVNAINATIAALDWLNDASNWVYTQNDATQTFTKRLGSTQVRKLDKASTTQAGLMTSAMVAQQNTNTANIAQLQGVGRVAGHLGQTPTQQDLIAYWTSVMGNAPSMGATVVNLDQDNPAGHAWTYYETAPNVFEFIDRGIDTVGIASATNTGLVSIGNGIDVDANGKISVDGSAVNGMVGNGRVRVRTPQGNVATFYMNDSTNTDIDIPVATATSIGLVKVDGTTTTVDADGTIHSIATVDFTPPSTGDVIPAGFQFLAGSHTKDYGANYLLRNFTATDVVVMALQDFTWSNFWTHLENGQISVVGGSIESYGQTAPLASNGGFQVRRNDNGNWVNIASVAVVITASYSKGTLTLSMSGDTGGTNVGASFNACRGTMAQTLCPAWVLPTKNANSFTAPSFGLLYNGAAAVNGSCISIASMEWSANWLTCYRPSGSADAVASTSSDKPTVNAAAIIGAM